MRARRRLFGLQPMLQQHIQTLREALLAEYLTRLQALDYSPLTIRVYRLAVLRLFRTYPAVPLEVFTPEHIERHIYARAVGPRTKATEMVFLSGFFRFLMVQKRLLKVNPCARAERPRWTGRLRPAPSLGEFEAIRRTCRTLEEAVFVELLYFTGLRLREALGLHVRHVQLEERRILVIRGKGGTDRIVIFPARLQQLLRRFIQNALDAPLFPSRRHPGRVRGVDWVAAVLGRLGREAGLPYRLTAHLLRHGFVRLVKTSGMPLDMAAKQLGHASILTTSRLYGQVDVGDLQEAYDRFLSGLDRSTVKVV